MNAIGQKRHSLQNLTCILCSPQAKLNTTELAVLPLRIKKHEQDPDCGTIKAYGHRT